MKTRGVCVAVANLAKCCIRHCSTELPTRILYTCRLHCNKKIIRFKLALLRYYQIYYITVRYAIQVPLGDTYSCSYVCIHIKSHSVRRNLHYTRLINMRDTIILTFTADCDKYIYVGTCLRIYYINILLWYASHTIMNRHHNYHYNRIPNVKIYYPRIIMYIK